MFGLEALFRLLLGLKTVLMVVIIGALLLANYVQHELHKGTKAQLDGMNSKLEACERTINEINASNRSWIEYNRGQDDVLENYRKTMPKKPNLDDFPDDDGTANDAWLRRKDAPPGGQPMPR
jgi:hypothetical protein